MTARILIVDDNLTNLRLASDVLVSEGFTVEQAQDAEEACRLLGQRLPDLILMDIGLPGMDGLTLTRLLKAESRFAPVPIVALTASAMRGDEERALAAGCVGYITKPINTRTLARQIQELLDSRPGAL